MNGSPMKNHDVMSKTIVGNLRDLDHRKSHLEKNNQKELERILTDIYADSNNVIHTH